MDDSGAATLEVGFQINFGDAFGGLKTLDDLIGSTAANAVRDFRKLSDAVSHGLDLGEAALQFKTFGSAATRELENVRRETSRVEKSGEALVSQLERQGAAFGKTREELRGLKAETAALAAEQQGLTELAGRIRAAEAALYDQEFAAQRRARQEAEAAAEAKAAAAQEAANAVALEAQAVREASFAYGQFEAAARRGIEMFRGQEAAARAAVSAEAALAQQAFVVRAAIDPMFAAQQRFDAELTRAEGLLAANVISEREYAQAVQMARDSLYRHAEAVAGVNAPTSRLTTNVNANRAAMAGLSFQAQDTFTQLSMGANAFSVIAIQGGQAAGQMMNMEGRAGSVAKFLVGPWGLAITAGLLVLGALTKNLHLFSDATDDAVDKLRKDAETTETARQAKERFATSEAGVAAAIRDATAATRQSIDATRTSAEAANIAAKNNLELEISKRRATKATLDGIAAEEIAAARAAGGSGVSLDSGEIYTPMIGALRAQIATQTDLIGQAERRVEQTRVTLAFEAAEQQATAVGRVTRAYDEQLRTLERTVRLQVEAGRTVDASLTQQVLLLRQRRQAAIDAAQAEQRLHGTSGEFGRSVSSSEAAAIARGAGFQVNSADRTFASQKALYDRWVAAGRPSNNPVAAPGSSAHEFGNALDLQKTAGLTVQRIKDAFAAEGVRLTKVISEQGHWHVEWSRSAEDIRAVSDAHHDAAEAARAQLTLERELSQMAHGGLAMVGPSAHADADRRAAEEQKRVWKDLFGDDDPLGDSLRAGQDALQAKHEAASAKLIEDQNVLQSQLRTTASLAESLGNSLSAAFGRGGQAMDQALRILGNYGEQQQRIDQQSTTNAERVKLTRDLQISSLIGLTDAGKNLFKEHSAGYQAMEAAEKALTIVQLARTAVDVAGGAARMFASLGPFAFPAVAAMLGVMAGLGFGGGSSTAAAPTSSEELQKAAGTFTVLGSPNDKSASIAHSLDLVAKNTGGSLDYSSRMLSSLKSIDASIGALATTVARQLNVSGALGDTSKLNLGSSGSSGFIGLFASATTRTLYDAGITLAATTVGNIVANGIVGQTYQIVEQVKKSSGFLGIGGGTKTTYQTSNGALPTDITASIQSVIKALEDGIVVAADAIGVGSAKAMLDNFNVSIGQLSFNGLDAQGIQDQLNAVFSSIGDQMVTAILPDVAKFQKAGEGLFETLERVASTVIAVDAEFQKLGRSAGGVDVDLGIASQFDSVSDFTSAADTYFKSFYSTAEQTAAQLAAVQRVFQSLNLTMPDSLASFRSMVDGLDLSTTTGQQTYATLLKVAPAFADLQQALNGAKSAADVLSERQNLQKQLWELQGNTAAIQAAQLADLDASNRGLQQQVWAAQAAKDLANAWSSVGDSITAEIARIRGLTDTGGGGFAQLQGQFNAATDSARGGDQDAAKSLPGLSQALLTAAAAAATSRQELDRVQAQTAASLEQTKGAIDAMSSTGALTSAASTAAILAAAATTQAASAPTAANDDMLDELRGLRAEVASMRTENTAGHSATAGNTGRIARKLDDVTAQSGGDAIATVLAA